MKFTVASVKSIVLPEGVSEKTYFCGSLPGFGVRVRSGGGKTYVVQYKTHTGKNRRVALGSTTAVDLGKARAAARDILAKVRLGQDPAGERIEERRKVVGTFGALLPRFLDRQAGRLKPRSLVETRRHLEIHAKPLHGLAVEKIDRRAIAILIGKIAERSGPFASNRVRASLSTYFTWLAREAIIESSPTTFTNKAVEAAPRDRVLSDDELARIWRALDDSPYSAIVKLLMLTGCRREEIGGLLWSEIDFDEALIKLPPSRVKGGREHIVTLAPIAIATLDGQPRRVKPDGSKEDLVFGHDGRGWRNWSFCKGQLNARIDPPIPGWRLHDFRRSVSTSLHQRFGIQPHVVESVLGHVGGHQSGIAGVYNRSRYLDQKRAALTHWAGHLLQLATGEKPSTIVTFRR